MLTSLRRPLLAAAAFAALVLSLTGCAVLPDAKVKATSMIRAATIRVDDSKRTMLVATAKTDQAICFTRPPLGLHGAWRVEVTAGIYDVRKLDEGVGALFGLEADLVAGGNLPTEFYGVYARRFAEPAGLQVFASSHDGNHGQVFFLDAYQAELAIESDGNVVSFYARDPDEGGPWQLVGTRSFESPAAPHYPGFGFFNANRGASFGFTNFRVPSNGVPAEAQEPALDALDAVYAAALEVLEASYLVDETPVSAEDAANAAARLAVAETRIDEAKAAIDLLADTLAKRPTPKAKALKHLAAAKKAVTAAKNALTKKGAKAAPGFLKSVTRKMFASAWNLTDLLLPDDLRETLPGRGV